MYAYVRTFKRTLMRIYRYLSYENNLWKVFRNIITSKTFCFKRGPKKSSNARNTCSKHDFLSSLNKNVG